MQERGQEEGWKKNNYRKPPVKRQKSPVPPSEEFTSEDGHKSSNEDGNVCYVPDVRVLRRRVFLPEEDSEKESEVEDQDDDMDGLQEEDQIDELEDDEGDSSMDVDIDNMDF
jgi:hypothetical protein